MKTGLAIITFSLSALSFVLLVLLHFLEPQFDPNWHFVSEYALGPWGWLMSSLFLLLALACWTLVPAMWRHLPKWGGRLGLALVVLGGLALAIAAFNATDPILSAANQITDHGKIHGLMAMIGNPALATGMLVTSLALGRRSQSSSRPLILASGILPWLCIMVMFATIGISLPAAGSFGPGVPIGWPNRMVFFAYELWLAATGIILFKRRSLNAS